MRNVISFVFLFLTVIRSYAQIDIKIMDFTIIPLEVFIDKNNNYHRFEDLFHAGYGIYVKLLIYSEDADTLLTNQDAVRLIESGSEKSFFNHWGNKIILFSDMDINCNPPQLIYLNALEGDTVHLFMYGDFSEVLYETIRRRYNCGDCDEVILRKPMIIERWIRKKTKLRIFFRNKKCTDVKCSKIKLIEEFEKRNYYLLLWKSMIRYQNITNY